MYGPAPIQGVKDNLGEVKLDARWHHGQTLAAGQVVEFKVWAELGARHRRLDRFRGSLLSLGSIVESMLA